MVKAKAIWALFLMVLCVISLTVCGDPQKEIHVYGRFQDVYTEDAFKVECDWEHVNPLLDGGEYENYGLFIGTSNTTFLECEEMLNCVALRNYPLTDDGFVETVPGAVQIIYGAVTCNSIQSQQGIGNRYFIEPMVEIYLYNPDEKKGDIEPDYIQGYRAVYSLDGELALEEGQWFLDEDKDEFCQKHFEVMLKAIGKGE